MKNITIAIDDDVHRLARVHAAQHGTSVSALVKTYLRQIATAYPPGAASGVREMQTAFHPASLASIPPGTAAPGPWVIDGKQVWTIDGKSRQPGALRGDGGALGDWPDDVLASLGAWDEDQFDALP